MSNYIKIRIYIELVFLIVLVGDNIGVEDFAIGIGVMFLARAIGVGIGPLISKALFLP